MVMKMAKAIIMAELKSPIEKVWEVVTDNEHFQWRSDLSKITCSEDGTSFTEYAKNAFPTFFTITKKEACRCYEFDMKNQNMEGHWSGNFEKTATGGTKLTFAENLEVHHPIMRLLAGIYLKKQQSTYVRDLRKALGE